MIDFFELRESLNRPYRFTKHKLHAKSFVYRFIPDDKTEVDVIFRKDEPSKQDTWNVAFERNQRQDMTGEGDAMKILATVVAVIKDFAKTENPEVMEFSAVKPDWFEIELGDKPNTISSREKVYKRMVQRYAPQMGYKYVVARRKGATDYMLVRK